MRRSEAAKYARWSAVTALVLAGITAVVYLEHRWAGYVEKKKAPPAAPKDVARLSSGLTFSKVEQNRKIFTVEASKSTEFKDRATSLLEDVKITIFGKAGDRHDVIHTQSCQYGRDNGSVVCSGDVQIDLESAADAERNQAQPDGAAANRVHVETKGVAFDRASGAAKTDQRVTFVFPNGTGEGIGVEYNSDEGRLQLMRDVRMNLAQPAASGTKKRKGAAQREPEVVHVQGTSLDFSRDSRLLLLRGPAQAETSAERLTAPELLLELDGQFHAQTLRAKSTTGAQRPELTMKGAHGEGTLNAEDLTAHFAPEGWLTKIEAQGAVKGSQQGSQERDEFASDAAIVDLWPHVNQPKEMNLKGGVFLKTQTSKGDARTLQTNALKLLFSGGKEGEPNRVQRAETLEAGSAEWLEAATQTPGNPIRTKLQADKLALDFGGEGKARLLTADGNVRTERTMPGKPLQTATARNGEAKLLPSGGWSQMDLQGNVKLKEGDRNGQAARATFVRADQTVTLAGNAVVSDATTRTAAPAITFFQATGDIRAEGGVKSTDLSAKSGAVQLAQAPSNITADTLRANSNAGRAFYTGHARLWQGDSVLEADAIELQRDARILKATGNVRGVFPQAPAQKPGALNNISASNAKKNQLWHVSSGTLTYKDAESLAHLEKDVVVQSAEQRMQGPILDLYFTRSAQNTASNGNASSGAQQISRAVGVGGVIVEEGGRKAVADRGEYTAADGKFVMSGGTPTLYDGSEGSTTGRQLTFFLADDTIIIDSENGSRTLTKHRVDR